MTRVVANTKVWAFFPIAKSFDLAIGKKKIITKCKRFGLRKYDISIENKEETAVQ